MVSDSDRIKCSCGPSSFVSTLFATLILVLFRHPKFYLDYVFSPSEIPVPVSNRVVELASSDRIG
jgi:hypothetical protein